MTDLSALVSEASNPEKWEAREDTDGGWYIGYLNALGTPIGIATHLVEEDARLIVAAVRSAVSE